MLPSNDNRFILCGAALLVFTAAVFSNANKPLTMDEAMPFGWNARAINAAGIAVLGQRVAEDSSETVLEIAHPPLYPILLAHAFTIFGESAAAGRMIGVLCLILTTALLLPIAKQIFGPQRAPMIWSIAVAITAVNPYMVQYAMLVDIDTSILTLFMICTIYFFIRHLQINSRRDLIFAGIALAASFWAKEMTPPVLIIAIFFFLWIHAGFKQALQKTAALTAIGLGLFTLTWWIFCEATNVPPGSFVEFTILQKGARAAPFSRPMSAFLKIKSMLFWLSLPVLLLFFYYAGARLKACCRSKRLERQDFLLVYTGLMFFYTMIYIPSSTDNWMLKYDYPAMPMMVLAASAGTSRLIKNLSLKNVAAVMIAAVSISGFYSLCDLEDPLIGLAANTVRLRSLSSAILFSPLLLMLIVCKWCGRPLSWARAAAMAAGLAVLPMNAYTTIKQTADYTTSPSWDNYGEKGLAETIAYLAERVKPGDELAVRKDIGYYLNGIAGLEKIHWWYPMFRGGREKMKREFEAINASGKISFVVLGPYDHLDPAVEIVESFFQLDRIIGDFYIYHRRK